jgi:NAD(P)-dependent dehydrogenase (short-subunit alcohol dehydrogenase family)
MLAMVLSQLRRVQPVPKNDLSGKTVVVTGANCGIGLEAVKHFATMNPARLIIACRNQEKGETALKCAPLHLIIVYVLTVFQISGRTRDGLQEGRALAS